MNYNILTIFAFVNIMPLVNKLMVVVVVDVVVVIACPK